MNDKFDEDRTVPESCCIKNNTMPSCAGHVLSSETSYADLANVYHKVA